MILYWLYLLGAIALELIGTTCIKFSEGFTKLTPTVIVIITYVTSTYLLALSVKKIEVGIAYAIWSGLGTAIIAIIGVVYLNESISILKLLFIALIIIGAVGLSLIDTSH